MKNRQALVLLFCANAISGFAQGISMLAIPWYFAKEAKSGQFNLIFGVVTFLTLFWGLYAGTLVDRIPRKKLFLATNLTEGIVLLIVAAIGWNLGHLPVSLIIIVFAVTAFGYRLHYPNLYAFVQEMTPSDQYSRVTSYIEIVGQATNVIAGAFAVILLEGFHYTGSIWLIGDINWQIEAWSIYKIFTMDGITYFLSLTLISFIRYIPDKEFKVESGLLIQRLKSGFRFLNQNRLILLFGFFSHSIFVIFLVTLFAVMPLYITRFLNEGGQVFGIMEVLYGLGALMAGFFIRHLTRGIKTTSSIIWLMVLTATVLMGCAFIQSTPFFLVVGVIIGFANAGTRVLRVSFLLRLIPNEVIGRVNSIFSLLNIMVRGFFVMLFSLPLFSTGTNITYAYVILSVFIIASGAIIQLKKRDFESINTTDKK